MIERLLGGGLRENRGGVGLGLQYGEILPDIKKAHESSIHGLSYPAMNTAEKSQMFT